MGKKNRALGALWSCGGAVVLAFGRQAGEFLGGEDPCCQQPLGAGFFEIGHTQLLALNGVGKYQPVVSAEKAKTGRSADGLAIDLRIGDLVNAQHTELGGVWKIAVTRLCSR